MNHKWSFKFMLAFHNDPAIKEKYLNRIKAHKAADEIVQGIYWENGKGCAVGCTIEGDNHIEYEFQLGIPEWLARVEDRIFENLPNELAKEWPLELLETIPVGKDFAEVWAKFCIFLMLDKSQCAARVKKNIIEANRCRLHIEDKNWDYHLKNQDDKDLTGKTRAYWLQSRKLLEILSE